MQFVEAFNDLGYDVPNHRQAWSAEKSDGICITLWKAEMGKRDGLMWMDTRVHADSWEDWGNKPGNKWRIGHLRRALGEFGGKVDVVIVSGKPGESYGTAQPWKAEGMRAHTYWQVSNFEETTGHFEVSLQQNAS